MKLEVIASDLDGTLLDSQKKISAFTQDTLINFEKQGKTVILASGRYEREVSRYAKQLRLQEFGGYMVCGNGFEVIDCKTGHIHHFDTIGINHAKELVQLAKKHHLFQYISIDGIYHLSANAIMEKSVKLANHSLKFFQRHGLKKFTYTTHLLDETIYTKDMLASLTSDVVKIAVSGTPANLKNYMQTIQKLYPNMFAFYYVNSMALEICSATVSKKNAVQYVCEQLGYSLDNVIAFGDSGNDEPLLKAARVGITMKNGSQRALRCARLLSDYSNDEDGVAKEVIKHMKQDS